MEGRTLNRFSTSLLFYPISDEAGQGFFNVANIEWYERTDTGMALHMISGNVLDTTMTVEEFTKGLKAEVKAKAK